MSHLKQCLGVDLGNHTIKIVEIVREKGSARIVRAAQAPTGVSPGMSDEEKRAAIASTTRDLLKQGKFGTKKCVVSISGLKVFVRRFRLPITSVERLERMIQFEARQQIPFPVEKTYLQSQWREIPGEGDVEVLLSAVRTDEIREFMLTVSKCGLKPFAVGVSSFALYNSHRFMGLSKEDAVEVFPAFSVAKPKPKKEKKGKKGEEDKDGKKGPEAADADANTLVLQQDDIFGGDDAGGPDDYGFEEVKGLVNIGATSYDIAIGRMGKEDATILFIRTVAMGGDNMTKAVMKALEVENYHDAEKIKTSSAQMMAFNFDFEEETETNQEASMAVTEVADRMVTEIRRSLDFFITQPDGMAIDSLVLSGGQAQIPQFAPYLEEKLTVPVELSDVVPDTCALTWPGEAGLPTPYLVAVGLGLQGIGLGQVDVDFLPEDRKIIRDFPYKITAVMAVLLLVIIGIASQAGQGYGNKFEAAVSSIQTTMSRQQEEVHKFNEAQAAHDAIAEEIKNLSETFGQRDFWFDFLTRLTAVKPPQVLIEDMQLDHNGAVKITGLSEVPVAAADFEEAIGKEFEEELAEAPTIDNVEFVRRQIEGLGSNPSRFTMSFKLKTKQNHLKITPTPSPTPEGGGNQGFGGGALGMPGGMGAGAGRF